MSIFKSTVAAAIIIGCVYPANADQGALGSFVASISTLEGAQIPEPSPNFAPIEVLPGSPEDVFDVVTDIFDDGGVVIVQADRAEGRVTTDYIAGPTSYVLGFLGGTVSRYRYLVTIREAEGGSTIRIKTFLESSSADVQSWHDVAGQNPTAMEALRLSLYEAIQEGATSR